MKQILFLLIALPFMGFSQTANSLKSGNAEGFVISGEIKGFPDSTSVSFFDDSKNALEKKAIIENGKFVIKGTLTEPSVIILVFGEQPPAVPLFIGNDKIKIEGSKEDLENLSITGSETQTQFAEYSKALKPYEQVFAPEGQKDPAYVASVEKISEEFVKNNPSSYVAPIAIIRILQSSENVEKADKLFQLVSADVKKSKLAQYLGQQLALAKINPVGGEIADFSQQDTAGRLVKISSLRGKYVLIDFWASWCRPCRMENPNVVAAFNKYHQKSFTVLGVSLDQAKPAWLQAIKMDGLAWTQVSDLKGWGNEVAALFHITSIPQNILIDPQGKIIAKNLRGEALNSKLETLFK
ncbi:MAG: TlpA disulfide reductase family protein [Ginsengibacter sp.]